MMMLIVVVLTLNIINGDGVLFAAVAGLNDNENKLFELGEFLNTSELLDVVAGWLLEIPKLGAVEENNDDTGWAAGEVK